MNAIFFEVSGVLNSTKFNNDCLQDCGFLAWKHNLLQQQSLLYLKSLVKRQQNTILVLTNTQSGDPAFLAEVQFQLALYDMYLSSWIDCNIVNRERKINDWLNAHPDVDNFIIFSGDSAVEDFIFTQTIEVNPHYGLTLKDIELARKMLREKHG